ncbi:MAG: hypothetical protein J6S60_04840 [Oscillospiraceae bacterium]|nr:hypothetical protein [Oscillospiraceae bacterium]
MAYIGLRYFAFAPIDTETEGADPTYEAGIVCGKAIAADVTWKRNDSVLRADDGDAEFDNTIIGGSINIDLDDLPLDVRAVILGGYMDTTNEVYIDTAAPGPYGGFGYIREVRHEGATRFDAFWCYKVSFGMDEDSASTMAESIEWQTPKLVGRIMGIYGADSAAAGGVQVYRAVKSCETYAAAKAWIDGKAGITAASSSTTTDTEG